MNRPNRQLRRRRGKDDHTDAEAAARAALGGEATAVPKSGDGPVEWIRMLTVTRRSAVKARTQAANQIHSLMVCAPEPLKAQLRDLNLKAQVRVCARLRPSGESSVSYAKQALRRLARRYQTLDAEIRELDVEIKRLCATANPALLAAHGVGPDSAAALLIAAGDNPARMKSERFLRCALRCQSRPSVIRTYSPAPSQPGRQPASQQRTMADAQPPGYAPTLPPKNMLPDAKQKERAAPRSSDTSNGTSPHKSTASSSTRHQPRTARNSAADANKPTSPSPKPPTLSEPTPAASQHSS